MRIDTTDINRLYPYERIRLPESIEINGQLVEQLINNHEAKKTRYDILDAYYRNRTPILDRDKPNDKANNKLMHDYAAYITDVATGIFIGKPAKYSVSDDLKDSMNEVQKVFDYNDEEDENHELARQASKFGVGYEIVYTCEEGYVRIDELDPRNVVYVYDNKINAKPLFAIHYNRTVDEADIFNKDTPFIATVYTRYEQIEYLEGQGGFIEQARYTNIVEGVPVVEFMNNNEYIGDYEKVIPLIDAYNKAISDTANDFEEFTDAILVVIGMLQTNAEDLAQMKRDKAIAMAEGQKVEWLTKEINDTALENHLTRLDTDIHKFAKVPNLSDENFAGNSSGVALAYKLIALRQVIASKQRKFQKALQYRMELIIELLKAQNRIKDNDFTYRDIDITFTENIPINIKENVETVKILSTLLSQPSWLKELYCITDVNDEIERIEDENNSYFNLADLEQEVINEEDNTMANEEVEEV